MENSEELLYRQIHPNMVQGDLVNMRAFMPSELEKAIQSSSFKPTPKDKGMLSTYDGSKISAIGSFHHFTGQGFDSVGVLGVTEKECNDLQVPVIRDGVPFPEHASIDFNAHNSSKQKKIAQNLRSKATQRGWQYLND